MILRIGVATLTDDKVFLLRMHECGNGLDDAVLEEIASAAQLMRCESGDVIHQADEALVAVYLIVQGRVKVQAFDMHGRIFLERTLSRGDQFGGLSAALAEPIPVEMRSHGPCTLLKFEYDRALELTHRHPSFRSNFSKLIARSVQKSVFGDKQRKKAALVAVFHESPKSRELTVRLLRRLVELGEQPCLFTDLDDPAPVEGVRTRSIVEDGRTLSYEELRQHITDWNDTQRVFIDLDLNDGVLDPLDVLRFSEQLLWCIEPEHWQRAEQRLRELKDIAPLGYEKIAAVWLLEEGVEKPPIVPELKELALEDFKISFQEPLPRQSRVLVNGVERLIHLLRGVRIGVALGGGAARGMAHLGVLKALEEQGIVVDMIAGTSAGAMTGTVIAAGMEADYCTQCFLNDLTPSWLFRLLPRGKNWYLLYKYRTGQFDPMLRKYLGDTRIEQLPLPMHAVTVDLIGGRAVVRESGDAVHAILESINLPVLSTPICREGKALVDGGLVNNVPADVLVEHGCNFVIAVSVTAKLESKLGNNRPDTPTEQMRSPSTLQTILRSYVVQNMNMNSIGVQPADMVIEPDVTAFDLSEFMRTDELAAVGEKTTLQAMPKLRKLLHKLDDKLFAAPTNTGSA